MNTKHETPILTRVLFAFGIVTIILAVIGGGVICVAQSLSEGIAIIIGGIFAGIVYLGIGQVVDYLARTAHSTDRLCTILDTSIMERLRVIENSSLTLPVTPTTSSSCKVGYYYSTNGEQEGPVEASDLRLMRKDGLITDDTPVLREGESEWRRFRDYLALSR